MDPIQAIAARQVSSTSGSTAKEVEAFYNDNAFEKLHAARRALRLYNRILATMARRAGINQNGSKERAEHQVHVRKVTQ